MTVNAIEAANYNRERTYTIKFDISYSDSLVTRTSIASDFTFEFIIACGASSSSIADPMPSSDAN